MIMPITILNHPVVGLKLHRDTSKAAVLLIGGIGITPVFSKIKDATEKRLPHRLLGGRMTLEMNEDGGRAVGSHIRLFDGFLGGSLSLEEVIIQREPLHDKTWRTTGPPDFLVLGEYQFSIHIEPGRDSSRLTIARATTRPPAAAG